MWILLEHPTEHRVSCRDTSMIAVSGEGFRHHFWRDASAAAQQIAIGRGLQHHIVICYPIGVAESAFERHGCRPMSYTLYRHQSLDDNTAVGIGEMPYSATLAEFRFGDVWQPVRKGAESADQLPDLVSVNRDINARRCLGHGSSSTYLSIGSGAFGATSPSRRSACQNSSGTFALSAA